MYRTTFVSEDTDLVEWLDKNSPRNYQELKDLRAVLYARRKVGLYESIDAGETNLSEPKVRLKGPNTTVLILSNRARHFLLRRLCQMKHLR